MAAEQLVDGAGHYSEARCFLLGCGEPLHMVWNSDRAIYLDDTDETLRNPVNATGVAWKVECEAGHVVLLPAESGDDWYEFAGRCTCNPDYPDEEAEKRCAHNDMNRLRAVIMQAADQQ